MTAISEMKSSDYEVPLQEIMVKLVLFKEEKTYLQNSLASLELC